MTMKPLTLAELPALRALADKATPGPWRQHLVDDTTIIDATGEFVASTFPEGGMDDDIDYATDTEQREHSAAFIAAARTELPAALAEIERLRAENEKLREALKPFARADRAIGDEPGPYRFETGAGYRLIDRESLRRARRAFEGGDA